MFTRPKDVSWQIDYSDQLTGSGGALEGMIDTQHAAVVGHSYGGYTALAAAGAQLDLSGPTSWCVQYPDLVLPPEMGDVRFKRDFCDHAKQLADLAGLGTIPEGLWPSWGDARVDAIVPLAAAPLFFGSESTMAVTAPAMELVGSKDRSAFSELPLYQPYMYGNLGSTMKSLVKFENADHMVFGDDCDALPLLTALGAFFACSDPVWDMDRAHDLINHFTTAFLLATLKGDTDAAAALALDQVQFPGIEYQAQGF
jgi:predicted dienelactone hydrolase